MNWWRAFGCFLMAVSASVVFMALVFFVSLVNG